MAGEKTAKFYESLTAIAVSEAIKGSSYSNQNVYREVKLPGVSIRNDVVVGVSETEPSLIILVTHSNRETDWEKKFKRDSAELIELVINHPLLTGVFLVLFDNRILPRHLKIAAMSLSGIISVNRCDPKEVISGLAHDAKMLDRIDKLKEAERQSELKRIFQSSDERKSVFNALVREIKEKLRVALDSALEAGGYMPLTKANIARRETAFYPRLMRHTRFNRAISKLALFSAEERRSILTGETISGSFDWTTFDIFWPIDNKSKGQLLAPEGRSLYRCKDPEILGGPLGRVKTPVVVEGIADSLELTDVENVISRGRQPMANHYEERIRSRQTFDASIKFIRSNYRALVKGQKLGRLLIQISADPQGTMEKYCGKQQGLNNVKWNWLYTGLVALFKSARKSKQGYGTSKIAERIKSEKHRSAVGNTVLKNLESCLKTLDPELVLAAGASMASFLKDLSLKGVDAAIPESFKYFLMCEIEDKYIPNAIDVLPAMVELAAVRYGVELQKTYMTSCLAIASKAGGTAGRTNVYRSKDTIIWYKASHLRQNVLHKRKELQSTVASWWQTWDPGKEVFVPTKEFKKTILIIDGDWEEEDLKLMHAFGWDEFLYPDELDRLPALIV